MKVRSVGANIETLLADLRTVLRPLAAEWTGAAAENYQSQQALWDSAAQDLHAVLLRIASALDTSHTAYVDTESQLHSLWA